jgi:exodeoxyribonuclease V alpha subunit
MIDQTTINHLHKNGLLTDIDIYFAKFVTDFSAVRDPDIFLAAALVSQATGSGDICLDLETAFDHLMIDKNRDRELIAPPNLAVWLEKLKSSPAVGSPGQVRPLILDAKNRLYLYRYWDYENSLAKSIQKRVHSPAADLDDKRLKNTLDRLFPETAPQDINWQKIAAAVACLKHFSVITGGPGTGKTFTVTKVLALLLEQMSGQKPQIYLTAPTGKAAARLKEAVQQAKSQMNCDESIKAAIPSDVFTIHRMLKPITGSPYFRHNRKNPLMADLVVVDEASMVDLALMAKLLEAVPENGRLILIGDKDQLASVEAGSVLGDICDRDVIHGFSAPFLNRITELTGEDLEHRKHGVQTTDAPSGLQDAIVALQKSYRFAAGSGIGDLSHAVNRADPETTFQMLSDEEDKSITWQPLKAEEALFENLSRQIVSGYQSYLKEDDPAAALRRLQRFKILCALNIGPLGVQAINKLAEKVLSRQNLIQANTISENPWYAGRPVLITRNHYPLGLFNGDIGVTLPDAEAGDHHPAVFFAGESGEVRRFQPYQLPEHTTVYAMTVHKSQGSEFDEVLLILPDRDFPILTRELVYTALTRARKKITIWGTRSIIRKAIARQIERTSGLRDALWGA